MSSLKKFFFKGSLLIGAFNLICTAISLVVLAIITYAILRGYEVPKSSIEGFAYGFLKFAYLKVWIITIGTLLSQAWFGFFIYLFSFKKAMSYLFGLDRAMSYLFADE